MKSNIRTVNQDEEKVVLKNIKQNRIYALENEIGYFRNEINKFIDGHKDKTTLFEIWIYKQLIKSKKALINKIEKRFEQLTRRQNDKRRNK